MVITTPVEPSPSCEIDAQDYASLLAAVHRARLDGAKPPARPRPVIDGSWRRMEHMGVPIQRQDPDVDGAAMEHARERLTSAYGASAAELDKLLGTILNPTLADSGLVGIIATPDSRISTRFGESCAQRDADRIGFVHGARWGENTVGTNAIGIAARIGRPVQVHGPEHWCLDQHGWSCSAAPLRDPATGKTLGVLDISGPAQRAHPAMLGLVCSVAAQVELTLRTVHLHRLERLRTTSWHLVAGLKMQWVLCDRYGWVLGASGVAPVEHLNFMATSGGLVEGPQILPGIGPCEVAILGEVVLITSPRNHTEHRYVLDPAAATLELELDGRSSTHQLSGRHTAILLALAHAVGPVEPAELGRLAWGATAVTEVTVRAEVSRLRKRFPELVSPAPYRLLVELAVNSE